MTLSLPAAGVISAYDSLDTIGRIRLDAGEEVRFGAVACVGFRPALGQRVFVIATTPHPLGGLKASVVNTTGVIEEDRLTVANRKTAQDERERAEWTAKNRAKEALLASFPTPRRAAASDAGALEMLDALDALKAERLLTAKTAKRLPLGEHLGFEDFEWWHETFSDVPRDPFFFSFGGADGDHLGVYLYPPALDRGEPAPVVYYFHEHAPIYTPLADSITSFAALLRAKTQRGTTPIAVTLGPATTRALALSGDEAPMVHVRQLYETTDEKAALQALEKELQARGWTFQAEQCRFRIAAS